MQSTLVIGLGKTGWSCVKFLKQYGLDVCVIDTRTTPPYLKQLKEFYPDIEFYCGRWPETLFNRKFADMVISPGLAVNNPVFQRFLIHNDRFIGDIELFSRYVKAPVVAITGSNGKSSVTTLLGKVVEQSKIQVAVGGNLGTPILELLNDDIKLYILELSSFQLETTYSLRPEIAVLLNTSPDHMDRYYDFKAYQKAKARVFLNSHYQVYHANEHHWLKSELFYRTEPSQSQAILFNASKKMPGQHWGTIKVESDIWLCQGEKKVLATSSMELIGQHHFENALAVLAMSQLLKLPVETTKKVICEFNGLPHRCQLIETSKNIYWFNDSKATNVGAAIASIKSVGQQTKNKIILLAGGQGKNADFNNLKESVKCFTRTVIVFGQDAEQLQCSLSQWVPVIRVNSLAEAVSTAATVAQMGDSVLFAPACASFDMFESFEARGDAFVNEVKKRLL